MDEHSHKINQINAINPELAKLINKVEVIYLVTGGKSVDNKITKNLSNYDKIKQELKIQINNIIGIQERLDSGLYNSDSREYIGMKNTLRTEHKILSKNILIFRDKIKDNREPDEIEEQNEIITQVNQILPKYKNNLSSDEYKTNTIDDLISGALMGKNQEVITTAQQEMMNEIDNESKIQDKILDDASNTLEDLKYLSYNIKDTITAQNVIIEIALDKTDKTSNVLSNTTDRTKGLLKKLNSNSSKICSYIICIVILIALFAIGYNIINK